MDETVHAAEEQVKCVNHTSRAWNESKEIFEMLTRFLGDGVLRATYFTGSIHSFRPIATCCKIRGAVDTGMLAVGLFQPTDHEQELHVAGEPEVDIHVSIVQ